MKRFRITETVECCREVFIEAESWTEARDKCAECTDLAWKDCEPYLSRIDLALMGDEVTDFDFINVVEQVELTGFEDEDNPVLEELDKKLKEA